jgi:hypothetical protein
MWPRDGRIMSFTSPETLRGNFVLLRAGRLRLLLPQQDVGAAEYLDTETAERSLVALSARMTLLPERPPERFVVAPLNDGSELGWCWDELQVLIDIELKPQPLPPSLLTRQTPVSHYVEHEGELAYLCSAQRLSEFALTTAA